MAALMFAVMPTIMAAVITIMAMVASAIMAVGTMAITAAMEMVTTARRFLDKVHGLPAGGIACAMLGPVFGMAGRHVHVNGRARLVGRRRRHNHGLRKHQRRHGAIADINATINARGNLPSDGGAHMGLRVNRACGAGQAHADQPTENKAAKRETAALAGFRHTKLSRNNQGRKTGFRRTLPDETLPCPAASIANLRTTEYCQTTDGPSPPGKGDIPRKIGSICNLLSLRRGISHPSAHEDAVINDNGRSVP